MLSAAALGEPRVIIGGPRSTARRSRRVLRSAIHDSGEADAATRSFTQALDILPGDPQTLGERGFARLRGGDDAGARADFDRALALGGSRRLRAQLYFNVGLLAEKQGNLDDARAAYARSQRLHPTPAVAAKLDGGLEACPLEISVPPPIAAYRSWVDALRALQPASLASSEPAARAELCPADSWGCRTLEAGRIVMVTNDGTSTLDAVIEEDGQIYVIREAVARWNRGGFKCEDAIPEMDATIKSGIVRIDGAVTRCTTGCLTAKVVECSSNVDGVARSASFWDLRARKPLVGVTWDEIEGASSKALSVDDSGALSFEGCSLHRRIPYERPDAAPW